MDQHVEQRVVNCEGCSEGERVVVYNETRYECKAILELAKCGVPGHPAHHVLVYGCHIFVPAICPREAVERARDFAPAHNKCL